jgi:L-amino acid N-acyltransferase YncA
MINIRKLLPQDWEDVERIYVQGIHTGQATFQSESPGWEEWDQGHLPDLRYVAVEDNVIAGWIALSAVSGRSVYSGVAEISIYIGDEFRGQKIGGLLMGYLIRESEIQNIWTLQSGIFPENTPSIKLHQKFGFRIVGYREKIGKMNGMWRNVNLLERRSTVAGTD